MADCQCPCHVDESWCALCACSGECDDEEEKE